MAEPDPKIAALIELGVPANLFSLEAGASWLTQQLERLAAGQSVSFSIKGEELGRCYYRTTSLTIGAERDAPKGNSGTCTVLARGRHPLLGSWARTACEVDSSD